MLIGKVSPRQNKTRIISVKSDFKNYKLSSGSSLEKNSFNQTAFGCSNFQKIHSLFGLGLKSGLAEKFYKVHSDVNYLEICISKKSKLGEKPIIFLNTNKNSPKQTIDKWRAEYFKLDNTIKNKWTPHIFRLHDAGENHYSIKHPLLQVSDYINYAIYYQDTKKWDNNHGIGYAINPKAIIKEAILQDKKKHNIPSTEILRSGTTAGKIMTADYLSDFLKTLPETDEPIIAIVKDFYKLDLSDDCGYVPINIKSIIFTDTNQTYLDHAPAVVTSQVISAAAINDKKIAEQLLLLKGKYINLELYNNQIKWKKIKAPINAKNISVPKIEIPKIIKSSKILTSSEYTPELVGNKAYNLKRLEEMKKQGKLKNVIIPKSFAIPSGVYEQVLAANPQMAGEMEQLISEINNITDFSKIKTKLRELEFKILNYCHTNGSIEFPKDIEQDIIRTKQNLGLGDLGLARSSYNGEDAKGYAAAGLYDSVLYDEKSNSGGTSIFGAINQVWKSKWNYRAYMSRRSNKIDHNLIEPTVIIQDYIPADLRFTIYTRHNTFNNDLLIQMRAKNKLNPYIISYNTAKDEIKFEQTARTPGVITLDSKLRIVKIEKDTKAIKDHLMDDIENSKLLLRKIIKAAQEVESEFGLPQDIEGGIKFGKNTSLDKSQIYFWQTRNQPV